RRLLQLPGRLTRSARRWTLHLPALWPWRDDYLAALTRIRALAAAGLPAAAARQQPQPASPRQPHAREPGIPDRRAPPAAPTPASPTSASHEQVTDRPPACLTRSHQCESVDPGSEHPPARDAARAGGASARPGGVRLRGADRFG